jgi:formate hydrogenlyase transcriptional activator
LSLRKKRAMIKMNCAALPSNLIEGELFGHEKGAFTGAHARRLGKSIEMVPAGVMDALLKYH